MSPAPFAHDCAAETFALGGRCPTCGAQLLACTCGQDMTEHTHQDCP